MKLFRGIRVGAASFVAMVVLFSSFLVGCVTKGKNSNYGEGIVCDPPVELPPDRGNDSSIAEPILDNVVFDFDQSAIPPEVGKQLDTIVTSMKMHPNDTLLIEGHTCNSGGADYNMALGHRRAEAVKSYLIERGIKTERIQVKSFGETSPEVPNNSPANRKLNRRVVFQYTRQE